MAAAADGFCCCWRRPTPTIIAGGLCMHVRLAAEFLLRGGRMLQQKEEKKIVTGLPNRGVRKKEATVNFFEVTTTYNG